MKHRGARSCPRLAAWPGAWLRRVAKLPDARLNTCTCVMVPLETLWKPLAQFYLLESADRTHLQLLISCEAFLWPHSAQQRQVYCTTLQFMALLAQMAIPIVCFTTCSCVRIHMYQGPKGTASAAVPDGRPWSAVPDVKYR